MLKKDALNVLVVDKSAVFRRFLADIAETMSRAVAVRSVRDPSKVFETTDPTLPDVVLLSGPDGGAEALDWIDRICNAENAPLVVYILRGRDGGTIPRDEAMARGATAVLFIAEDVPLDSQRSELGAQLARLATRVHTARNLAFASRSAQSTSSLVRPATIEKPVETSVKLQSPTSARTRPIELVAICTSTGGPVALEAVVCALPGNLAVPVLIVQHMPAGFTQSLAESLSRKAKLPVKEATHNEAILANVVYIAPGGRHLAVRRPRATEEEGIYHVVLREDPPVNNCRPSADVLYWSIAETCSGNILAVVLTGMGSDGRRGVEALKEKSCYCITQSEESCTVYGMPGAVFKAGLSDASLPLDRIGAEVASIVRRRNVRTPSL